MTERNSTVFVLDDDPAMRDSLSLLLQLKKLPAEFFSTVNEFLDTYDSSRLGCLILDLRLPGKGGFELLETLSESRSNLPVIVITGHGDEATREKAIKLGAVAYFEKPFDPRKLWECIEQVSIPNAEST